MIDRAHRLVLPTTETRPNGPRLDTQTEVIFDERDGATLMRILNKAPRTRPVRCTSAVSSAIGAWLLRQHWARPMQLHRSTPGRMPAYPAQRALKELSRS